MVKERNREDKKVLKEKKTLKERKVRKPLRKASGVQETESAGKKRSPVHKLPR